jgi:hypothetical protein
MLQSFIRRLRPSSSRPSRPFSQNELLAHLVGTVGSVASLVESRRERINESESDYVNEATSTAKKLNDRRHCTYCHAVPASRLVRERSELEATEAS